jgi:DNA-binding transcriptional MocR family regulator
MTRYEVVQLLGSWLERHGPLYERLSAAFEHSIRTGELPVETRLPAERWLAQRLGVSRSTVIAAYTLLQERGWVVSRRGSGTKVCNHSPQRSMLLRHAQLNLLGHGPVIDSYLNNPSEIIDLSTGAPSWPTGLDPTLCTLSSDQIAPLLDAYGYAPQGLLQLRCAIAEYYTQQHLATQPEQILVTSGAQQAISLLATLMLQRGDVIILENPSFFGAIDAFRAAGARLVPVPIGANGLDSNQLAEHLLARMAQYVYLIPTFHNPTGNILTSMQRYDIVKEAQTANIPIIEDLTLGFNVLESEPPPPLACYGAEGAVITVGSLSKIFWAGLRVGWIRGSETLIERLVRLKAVTDLGSSLVSQMLGVKLFPYLELVKQLRREELAPRRDLVLQVLEQKAPSWRCRSPKGGLFIWTQLPSGDARDLAQEALHCGVKVTPGSTLSVDGTHNAWLRLPFFLPTDRLQIGLDRLIEAWQRYAGRIDIVP